MKSNEPDIIEQSQDKRYQIRLQPVACKIAFYITACLFTAKNRFFYYTNLLCHIYETFFLN